MRDGFQRGARTAPELSLARANERVGFSGIYLRVYWAGAAMMLAADLQLRNQTGGRQSLDTALDQLSPLLRVRGAALERAGNHFPGSTN